MREPKQPPKKRVVSKSKYAAYLAGKTTLASVSLLFWTGGILCILCAVFIGLIGYGTNGWMFEDWMAGLFMFGVIGTVSIAGGVFAAKTAKTIEPVLPPTRQSVEQLSAEETLVRASTEPTQGQEKVLLRAATAGAKETAPEQLLRPTTPD